MSLTFEKQPPWIKAQGSRLSGKGKRGKKISSQNLTIGVPNMPRQPAECKYNADSIFPIFEKLLPVQIINALITGCVRRYYTRLFPPLIVLWGFVYQRLNPDHSCDAALSYLSSQAGAGVRRVAQVRATKMSSSTAGYCKARQRLPLQLAQGALQASAQTLSAELGEAGLWHGRRVCLLDGSTLRLPATASLREHYGLPKGLRGESHWPTLRLVVGFDLWSGAVETVAEGPYHGMGETGLALQVAYQMPPGYIFMGDRLFGLYHLLQVVVHQRQDLLVRMNTDRVQRWLEPSMQTGSDVDVLWTHSPYDHLEPGLPAPAVPGRFIYVRIETPGFRPIDLYLFTTLTDRQQFPLADIVQLYARRWNVELDLRHVKTTLLMEALDGKSVDMVRRELILGLLAYNLIRGWMALAALRAHIQPLSLSLACCWRRIMDTWRSLPTLLAAHELALIIQDLLDRLAACRLPVRKQTRHEPRAVWGKAQPYLFLKGSRSQARIRWLAKLQEC